MVIFLKNLFLQLRKDLKKQCKWCFSWISFGCLKVTLTDGSFHAVDSDALSFEVAAKMAYRNASKAVTGILEPIMKIEVVTPEENMGDIVGDLNRRRGR